MFDVSGGVMERKDTIDGGKAGRNAAYLAKLDRAVKNYKEGKGYTFNMEDLNAFADGIIDKDQLLLRARGNDTNYV
jgi:hypothetical protein